MKHLPIMDHPLVRKASQFAWDHHRIQIDDDNMSHYHHCDTVANILSHVTNDPDVIAAGYLHDTIEDAQVTYWDLENEFNSKVAGLVFQVTKDHEGGFFNLVSREAALIKFADRLHNLSRMGVWSKERQGAYLRNSAFWSHEKGGE